MSRALISWACNSWHTVHGCSPEGAGCDNCWAIGHARRMGAHKGLVGKTATGLAWTGRIMTWPENLDEYMRKRTPVSAFVSPMSDLFHEQVDFNFVAAVFGALSLSARHTFLVATKRAARMVEFFEWVEENGRGAAVQFCRERLFEFRPDLMPAERWHSVSDWPLPNVWLGVSAETQATYDERVSLLVGCPAALHWVDLQPLLEQITLAQIDKKPQWVVIGGEAGDKRSRPCEMSWIRSLISECEEAGVACHVKQIGASPRENGAPLVLADKRGAAVREWPAALRVQEHPLEGAPQILHPLHSRC